MRRHAAQTTTGGRCTDVTLIDLRGALDKLGRLSPDGNGPHAARHAASVCRAAYSPADESDTRGVILDESARNAQRTATAASDAADNACEPLSIAGQMRAQGLEPWTYGSKGRCSTG